MSKLPGTIRVKRKLVEEPPEALYVEREGQESSLAYQHDRPVYRLVSQAKRARTEPSSHAIGITIKPVNSIPQLSTDKSLPNVSSATGSTGKPQADAPTATKAKDTKPPQPRRVFHLSRLKSSSLSRVSSSSSLNGSLRRRGKLGSATAIFSEKRSHRVDKLARTIASSRPGTPAAIDEPIINTKPRKRPLTKAPIPSKKTNGAESSSVNENEDKDSLKLAAQLRQFALDTIPQPSFVTDGTKAEAHAIKKKPLKFRPRSPPPRDRVGHVVAEPAPAPATIENDDAMDDEDSENWVYDLYVRELVSPASVETLADADVGVIVIRPEDEEQWEEFWSDEEDSEKDWAGEDDDSNAEDYYANDYPDEFNSDDDWFVGRSTDEEFQEDKYEYSDRE